MPPRMMRLALAAGGGALILFHALLFWRRLADATLLEPAVAMRWAGTVLLLAAASWLRRRGVSLAHGHAAAVFWLLVLLLHIHLPGLGAPTPAGGTMTGEPASLPLLLPVAVGAVAVGVLLFLAAGRLAAAGAAGRRAVRRPPDRPAHGVARLDAIPALSPRPPPVLV